MPKSLLASHSCGNENSGMPLNSLEPREFACGVAFEIIGGKNVALDTWLLCSV